MRCTSSLVNLKHVAIAGKSCRHDATPPAGQSRMRRGKGRVRGKCWWRCRTAAVRVSPKVGGCVSSAASWSTFSAVGVAAGAPPRAGTRAP
eukprot:51528-Prymnesium_polylepis.1